MADEPRRSIREDSANEIRRHVWIESERAGYDLGELAIRRWVQEHWHGYLRARWIEHMQGVCCWIELDCHDFGMIHREFTPAQMPMVEAILSQLKFGRDNLGIIQWAIEQSYPTDEVVQVLSALDVNSARNLASRRDPETPGDSHTVVEG